VPRGPLTSLHRSCAATAAMSSCGWAKETRCRMRDGSIAAVRLSVTHQGVAVGRGWRRFMR